MQQSSPQSVYMHQICPRAFMLKHACCKLIIRFKLVEVFCRSFLSVNRNDKYMTAHTSSLHTVNGSGFVDELYASGTPDRCLEGQFFIFWSAMDLSLYIAGEEGNNTSALACRIVIYHVLVN